MGSKWQTIDNITEHNTKSAVGVVGAVVHIRDGEGRTAVAQLQGGEWVLSLADFLKPENEMIGYPTCFRGSSFETLDEANNYAIASA